METLAELPWGLIAGLAATGIGMALASSLVGMRAKVENPAWWGLYLLWVAVVLLMNVERPFLTILVASVLAGTLHACTQCLLLDQYMQSNPWYEAKMQGPRGKIRAMFLSMGIVIGLVFGALTGGIAWGLSRL